MTMYDPYTDKFIVDGSSMLSSRGNPAEVEKDA